MQARKQRPARGFPSLGKKRAQFSKPRKNFREIFQSLEKPGPSFSNPWKTRASRFSCGRELQLPRTQALNKPTRELELPPTRKQPTNFPER